MHINVNWVAESLGLDFCQMMERYIEYFKK